MKKVLFFIYLLLFACVFANAQTVDTLDKAKNDYLFGNGAYTVGRYASRTVNVSCDSTDIGDIETGETVKVLVTLDSPAENWEVSEGPEYSEFSSLGPQSDYVFGIILVAGNTLGNDTLTLVGDGEIELTFNVVAPKKDFTVTDPNGETMHNGDIFTLTEDMKGKDLTITIDTKTANYSPSIVSGEMPITNPIWSYYTDCKEAKFQIINPSVDGKFQMKFTQDGYNDFVCYLEYTTPFVPVKKIVLSKTSGTLYVGRTAQLTATVLPEDATNKEITWKSKDESVATVDQNGNVTAISAGTTYVVAVSVDNPKVYAQCKVTVKNPVVKVKSVKLDKTALSLETGNTAVLKATVNPENATDKTVTWKSSNASVATVDKNGKIKAVKAGTAIITVITNDGGFTATCKVTVKNPIIKVKSVKLDETSLSLEKGDTELLKATVNPTNATDKTVTWKSSNTSVATVDQNGKITAVKAGTATITVITNDGGFTATCKVTVNNPVVKVKSVKLDVPNVLLSLKKGKTMKLKAVISPITATDKSVTWKSSDKRIATVDKNGVVRGLKQGIVYITVTTNDGKKTATCKISVK